MDCPIKECNFKYDGDTQLIDHFAVFHKNVCRYFTSSQNVLFAVHLVCIYIYLSGKNNEVASVSSPVKCYTS